MTQHNERQTSVNSRAPHGTDAAAAARVAAETTETAATRATPSLPSASMTSTAKEPAAPRAPVSKRKSSAVPTNSASEKAQPAAPTTPSTPSKVPWATNDEKVTKQAPAPMNLREIQEAEKKRQDARKAAEKEKERAVRAAAGASSNEGVQFTASWGLPTSQVGARNNSGSIPTTRETPATSPATSSAPVWTSATKPATKSMKEIQEEEERRKQAAKEKETAASAVKRLAPGPAVKVSFLFHVILVHFRFLIEELSRTGSTCERSAKWRRLDRCRHRREAVGSSKRRSGTLWPCSTSFNSERCSYPSTRSL